MSHSGEASSPSRDQRARVDDWHGLGDLVGLSVDRLTQPVQGMHRAIADRWMRLAGPSAAPLRRGYHAATAGIYESVRIGGSAVASAVRMGASLVDSRRQVPPLWSSPRGSGIRSIANAVWGDELERRGSALSITIGLRDRAGEAIPADRGSLAMAFPEPTSRLAVLLHGLGETERCWLHEAPGGETVNGVGEALETASFTPLLVRYNSGRRVSDSGMDLAALLEEIVEGWPVPVEEVALVGSSMGGLVVRAAVHAGQAAEHCWTGLARNVVTIGAPHLGAPLEKGAHLISWGLGLVADSRPLAELIDSRSAGVKDLRFGAIREADWDLAHPEALLGVGFDDVLLPEGVEQHFIAAVITADPAHPLGLVVGDLMVRVGSGTGRGRRRGIEASNVRVLGGRHHFRLLHDPEVHHLVAGWLVGEQVRPAS